MKKFLILLPLILTLLCGRANATTCTVFYTWITGDTITATRLNGNTNNLVTCGNAIDFNNIGTSGIKASNLKGSNGTDNTFGFTTAAVTLNVPEILGASAVTATGSVAVWNDNAGVNGLILNVPTNSTNGFQLQVNGSNVFQVAGSNAALGEVFATGPLILTNPVPNSPGSSVAIWNDNNAGVNGLTLNVPTGSTMGFRFQVNGSTMASVSNAGLGTFVGLSAGTGTVTGASDGATNAGIPPVYTSGGAALGGTTTHVVTGTISPTLNGNCLSQQNCALNTNATTLSGAAIFAGVPPANYKCTFSNDTAVAGNGSLVVLGFDAANSTASSVQVWAKNISAGTLAGGTAISVEFICVGK